MSVITKQIAVSSRSCIDLKVVEVILLVMFCVFFFIVVMKTYKITKIAKKQNYSYDT